jgi:hypothetical protein
MTFQFSIQIEVIGACSIYIFFVPVQYHICASPLVYHVVIDMQMIVALVVVYLVVNQ